MQEAINITNYLVEMEEDEDQEALELFKNIQLEQSNSEEINQRLSQQKFDKSSHSNGSIPRLSRLSKNNKESKKQSKIKKIKDKHKHKNKKSKHHRLSELSAPHKKLKRQSSKKKRDNSDGQVNEDNDAGSSQFSSESNNSEDLGQQLKNLNPENVSEEVSSPRKRLRKSGRKQKIEQKEGFRIEELGNQIERLSYQSGSQFSNQKRKKQRKKKIKARVPTNEEIMNSFKEHGVVQSEGEDHHGNQREYDSGLDMLHSMKSKRTNGIRINNRLFGDLQEDLQHQQAEIVMPQNLALQLKPKNSISSQRFSFLSKAETIKLQRGLQADVNKQQVQRLAMQKAKRSMAKVVSSMVNQNLHQDIDLQIRVPTITRGRSADLINNTVFLKNCLKRTQSRPIEQTQIQLKQTLSHQIPSSYNAGSSRPKKECSTRKQLFRQIQEQMRFRRSKYISEQELKNSFKKTNLAELQQTRKRIQQKKRKQMQSQSENQQGMDSSFNQMIEKQQMICGDVSNSEPDSPAAQNENKQPTQKQVQNLQKIDKVGEQQEQPMINNQQPIELPREPDNSILNEEFEQFKQMEQDSDLQQQNQSQKGEQQQQQQQQQSQQQQPSQKVSQDKQAMSNKQIEPNLDEIKRLQQDLLIQNQTQLRKQVEMKSLQEQGIINLRRKVNKNQIQQPSKQTQVIHQKKYLMSQMNEGQNPYNQEKQYDYQHQIEQNGQQFNNFRKLRKIAFVIAKKKKEREIGRQYAAEFIEHEAEQGSDNEQHDDIIKNIDDEDQNREYEGLDLDADLVELIDNAVDIDQENQFEAFRKYLEDVRMQDREQIKKIIRGQFKRKHDDVELQIEQDERKRQERMEEAMNWMKQREEQEGQNMYIKSPEPSNSDSEQEDEFGYVKQRKTSEKAESENGDPDRITHEEEMARLQKFLEETLPTSKREVKPIKQLTLLHLPQSVKFQKKNVSQKTISMSKLGSKNSNDINPQPMSRKNTSSLVNQILNKHSYRPKTMANSIFNTNKKK